MHSIGEQVKMKMKNQILKPTGEIGLQEKIPPGWKMNFAT